MPWLLMAMQGARISPGLLFYLVVGRKNDILDLLNLFQILLRKRTAQLNTKMHDGITLLTLAARRAIEGIQFDEWNEQMNIMIMKLSLPDR